MLGCPHFPFLTGLIQQIAGPKVLLIDPAVAVARELSRRLQTEDRLSPNTMPGSEWFWTSGPPDSVQRVISDLANAPCCRPQHAAWKVGGARP